MRKNIFSLRATCMSLALCTVVCASALTGVQAATLGGNANFDKVYWSGASSMDMTAAASDATANDVLVASSTGEYSYWGMQSPFDSIYFTMGTWGASGTALYEYSSPVTVTNLDGFSALNLTSNPSSDFTVSNADNMTSVGFTPPSDWVKSSFNGVSAYWVRISANMNYATPPMATTVRARAYNLKLHAVTDTGADWNGALTPTLGSNCGGINLGEWVAGTGVHYYALRTDAGACTLTFNNMGFVNASITANTLTTTLDDLSASPLTISRDDIVTTQSGSTGVPNVQVTLYTDAAYTSVADDLSHAGSADAIGTSDASGQIKFALASGTYYYKATDGNYLDTTGSFLITDGIANSHTISLTPSNTSSTVSASQSFVGASPATVTADNVQTATVTVTVRNASNTALSGKAVTLSSSLSGTVISPSEVTTDINGSAVFTARSSAVGNATFTAVADGVTISLHPTVSFVMSSTCPYASGSLVKLPDDGNSSTQEDSAVYYYGKDCMRHAFPNDKVYFSWYPDFNNVTIVSANTLANMTLGSNVTYRPGVKMVKFTTVPKTYAVANGGVLRWVTSESLATSLYGTNWNTKIDDISDAFFANYTFGADISSSSDYNPTFEMNNALTINDEL
ncbi:MAG: invasin domain 3-containing protein [Patescibacteria group bacterium]